MKNDNHRAYYTLSNFPLQIASLDSVRAHVLDQVRLISMLPAEWPKVRGRDIARGTYQVVDTSSFTTMDQVKHVVEIINFPSPDLPERGYLVDGKYYFTSSMVGECPSLQLLFEPLEMMDVEPWVRREWSSDYMVSIASWFALLPKGTETYSTAGEDYFPIRGYKDININCLADLIAYNYRFEWSQSKCEYNVITDMHSVTKRIRKPWFEHMVQIYYGERDHVIADNTKLISFLINKLAGQLTAQEETLLHPFTDSAVDMGTLQRLGERQQVLNTLYKAYSATDVMTYGEDPSNDPIFGITHYTFKETP